MSEPEWEVQDDERVLGPYPEQLLLEAIAARGLPATTNIRRVGGEMWMPIGSRQPFADACRAARPAAPDVPDSAPPQTGGTSRKWSTPAAVVAGILGLLLGVVALVRYLTREQRQCEEAIEQVKGSIDVGAWAAAEVGFSDVRRACVGREQSSVAELDRRIQEHIAATKRSSPSVEAPNPVRDAAQAKLNAAVEVWDAFGRLPLHKRTKDVWSDAIRESTTHGVGLASPYDAQFAAVNTGLARKHVARLINEEAIAVGENYTILVPSGDRVKCVIWASQWIQEAEGLTQLGFRKLRCEATSYLSKLTGKTVEEPTLEWEVP